MCKHPAFGGLALVWVVACGLEEVLEFLEERRICWVDACKFDRGYEKRRENAKIRFGKTTRGPEISL